MWETFDGEFDKANVTETDPPPSPCENTMGTRLGGAWEKFDCSSAER